MMRRYIAASAFALSLAACSAPASTTAPPVASTVVVPPLRQPGPVVPLGNVVLRSLLERPDRDSTTGRVYLATDWQDGTILIYPLIGRNQKFIGVFADQRFPWGTTVDAHGNIYATATQGLPYEISIFHPRAISPYRILNDPYLPEGGLGVDAAGNVYVAAPVNNEITVFAAGSTKPTGKLTYKQLVSPFFATAAPNGDIYADGLNCQWGGPYGCQGQTVIGFFKAGTNHFTQLKLNIAFPGGLIVDSHKNLLVVDQGAPSQGSVLDVFPPGATKPSKVYQLGRSDEADVLTVAIDRNEGRFFTADYTNSASEEYAYPGGTYLGSLVVPSRQYTHVTSVAVGPANAH